MFQLSKKITIFLIFSIILIYPLFIFLIKENIEVQAGLDDASLYGWAWSQNIGWISFNHINCDPNADGLSDGLGNCPPLGIPISSYGVNLDGNPGDSPRNLSGYAWSENIGWISFDPPDIAPAGQPDQFSARWENGGLINGWIRACAGSPEPDTTCGGGTGPNPDAGGWDGWIHMTDVVSPLHHEVRLGVDATADYGDEMLGWAWGGDVVGWISFNCQDRGICETTNQICDEDAECPGVETCVNQQGDGDTACTISDYKVVFLPANEIPTIALLPVDEEQCCHACPASQQAALGYAVTFRWDYDDPDNDPQEAYEIWVDDDSNFTDPKFNFVSDPNSATAYVLNLTDDLDDDWESSLNWNTTYYWAVRVKDQRGAWSHDWITDPPSAPGDPETGQVTTPTRAAPNVIFTWSPTSPAAHQTVQFTDLSLCYLPDDSVTDCSNWNWDFENGNPPNVNGGTEAEKNPTTAFVSAGVKIVYLTVTGTYECRDQDILVVTYPLPEWREIPPF